MTYAIHPEAKAELAEAAVYYAEQASPMIATVFMDEFERTVDLIVANQQCGLRVEGGLRLYHLRRFPYTIFYEKNETLGPQIFAVAHQRREPEYWRIRTFK